MPENPTAPIATHQRPPSDSERPSTIANYSLGDLKTMAGSVCGSFGLTPDQALTLFLISQAEGLHPMNGLRVYHIIENKPAMRADAMQARFQQNDGTLAWVEFTEQRAAAHFSHPKLCPEPVLVELTMADAQRRGLPNGKDGLKKNWRQSGAAMLRARVISAGVRMVYPGIVAGIYTVEEVEDLRDVEGHVTATEGGKTRQARARALVEEADRRETTAPTKEDACTDPKTPTTMTDPATAPTAVASSTNQASTSATGASSPAASTPTTTKPATPPKADPPPGLPAVVGGRPGDSALWLKLQEAGNELVKVAGKPETAKVLVRLNHQYQCGMKPGTTTRLMQLCPPECMREYLADLSEEIRAYQLAGERAQS